MTESRQSNRWPLSSDTNACGDEAVRDADSRCEKRARTRGFWQNPGHPPGLFPGPWTQTDAGLEALQRIGPKRRLGR